MKKYILLFLLFAGINVSAQEVLITDSIVIHLKSGHELTAIVVQNKAIKTPVPALLRYSIYANPAADKFYNSLAAFRGYVGVTIYVRGKYLSLQQANPFVNDSEDAWDIIDWVSNQVWCNGKVGMYGASYLGFSQWASVKKLHPALKTIVPQSAVGIGVDFPMRNNINSGYSLGWIHYVTDNKILDSVSQAQFSNPKKWNTLFNKWFKSGKSFASLDTMEGRPSRIFQEWLKHPGYDNYWKKMTPTDEEYAGLNIPVLTIAGYFDADQSGAMHYFKKHNESNKNANHYLVLGPYDHLGLQQLAMPTNVGGYDLDSVAVFKVFALTFGWFDYILKGGVKPALLKDKVNYEVMGANRWEHALSLAAITTKERKYFLFTDKMKGLYKLSNSISAGNKGITQEISFKDRTDTLVNSGSPVILDSLLHVGKNSLVFETDPFDHPVVIAGSLSGELSVIVNKKDVDITVQLYEKLADGRYLQLSSGILRASYSKDHSKRQLLVPGKPAQIHLTNNTFFTSRQIAIGSKLVFVTGVLMEPGIEVNYGTGKMVSQETIADGKQDLIIEWLPQSFISVSIQ
jgi:putative CocE/NonD family hydrolase